MNKSLQYIISSTVIVLFAVLTLAPAVVGVMGGAGQGEVRDLRNQQAQGVLGSLFVPEVALADTPRNTGNMDSGTPSAAGNVTPKSTQVSFENPLKYKSVELLLAGLVSWAVRIGTLIAIFFFIYAGFRYVTSMGSDDKLKEAKKTLTNAAIGTIILLGANVIVTLIQNTLNSIQK